MVDSFADPDRTNMYNQPVSTGGEIGPSPPHPINPAMPGRYMPMAGRADRLSANIPGGVQSDWGANGDHLTGGRGGAVG